MGIIDFLEISGFFDNLRQEKFVGLLIFNGSVRLLQIYQKKQEVAR